MTISAPSAQETLFFHADLSLEVCFFSDVKMDANHLLSRMYHKHKNKHAHTETYFTSLASDYYILLKHHTAFVRAHTILLALHHIFVSC